MIFLTTIYDLEELKNRITEKCVEINNSEKNWFVSFNNIGSFMLILLMISIFNELIVSFLLQYHLEVGNTILFKMKTARNENVK